MNEIRHYSQTIDAAAVRQALGDIREELGQNGDFITDEHVETLTKSVLDNPRRYKPGDGRAYFKAMKERTGFSSVRYDCCRNSCISYALYPDKDECYKCGESRWKDDSVPKKKREPAKTHLYFPIRHRLLLWFTSTYMSRLLTTYRRKAVAASLTKDDKRGRRYVDVWSGNIYKELRKKGKFADDREIGFACGFDGTKAFKARRGRFVWPIILTCMNLPPEIRFKRKNVLVVGFIPGPNQPRDVDSFLSPLVDEMGKLSTDGIANVWDAASAAGDKHPRGKRHEFTLRAHLCLVTTDMPARTKALRMMGFHSISYCEYCQIKGLQYTGMHCPHKPPTNLPDSVIEDQINKRDNLSRPCYNWEKDYTYANSTARTDKTFRDIATYIDEMKDKAGEEIDKYAETTGIAGKSIFARLDTIFFPWSFPPCTMHLYYENVVRVMFEHYAGRFFVKRSVPTADSTDKDNIDQPSSDTGASSDGLSTASDDDDEINKASKKRRRNADRAKRKKRKEKERENAKKKRDSRAKQRPVPMFARRKGTDAPFKRKDDDPYNIPPDGWREIGMDTAKSNATYPDQFGESMGNLTETFRKMKAANWQRFVYHQSPIYFRKYLPKPQYNEWMNLVEAMRLSTRKVLDGADVLEVWTPPFPLTVNYNPRDGWPFFGCMQSRPYARHCAYMHVYASRPSFTSVATLIVPIYII